MVIGEIIQQDYQLAIRRRDPCQICTIQEKNCAYKDGGQSMSSLFKPSDFSLVFIQSKIYRAFQNST